MVIPSAPVVAEQPAPLVPDMTSTVVNAVSSDSGERTYRLPGNREKISAQVFMNALANHQAKLPSETLNIVAPLNAGTNEYEGVQVYRCLGAYRGDEYCIMCPLRKACITRR